MNKEEKKKAIAKSFKEIMITLGLDVENDDSLQGTPARIAKMYIDEIFIGLDKENYPRIMTVSNEGVKYNQMLVERDVKINSVCEHHFQNIIGVAHIAYIPKKRIVGLSKLNRIADFWARRPQVQERLTSQIHEDLVDKLGTEDVAVIIDCEHHCVKCRGVMDTNSSTITSKLGGEFNNPEARKELMDLITLNKK